MITSILTWSKGFDEMLLEPGTRSRSAGVGLLASPVALAQLIDLAAIADRASHGQSPS